MSYVNELKRAFEKKNAENFDLPKPPDYGSRKYAIWRFLKSWRSKGEIGPDQAVLLRQIARWSRGDLFVGELPEEMSEYIKKTDINISSSGRLSANPFAPEWLADNFYDEESGIDTKPENRRCDESIMAESYLQSMGGFKKWHSQAQKEAVWMSVTAQPGSNTLVALPTGSGKSMCFQMLSRFGTGLTVVIVPTVALAIDQYKSAKWLLKDIPDVNPLYYSSDSRQTDPEMVADSVRNRQTRLLFTSPEACVSGKLRNVLEAAAKNHFLENLVIDEAHIIESWGIYFRIDFQMLSLLREKWLDLSENSMRTFLLSATFTPNTHEVLQNLYGKNATRWQEFVSQRLRPEINYFRQLFNNGEKRKKALKECIWKLPRPAILYTTEVADSRECYELFHEMGFKRIGCFNGETRSIERHELLDKWRNDDIDLMVATSAFGMGVDKSDVRTVIHACLPENMHRYYQEVGRSGRDGKSSIALLLSTPRDIEVAKGMAPKLLTSETLQKRWEGLWKTREDIDGANFVCNLNTHAKRTELLGTRTYNENIRWNKRLILQLLRAGKLELLDIEHRLSEEENGEPAEWVKVKLKFTPISPKIGDEVQDTRAKELNEYRCGLEQMLDYLYGKRAICRLLRKLYGERTQRVCGGCPECRKHRKKFQFCPPLDFSSSAVSEPRHSVVVNVEDPRNKKKKRSLVRNLRSIVSEKGVRRFAVSPDQHESLLRVFAAAFNRNCQQMYRVDKIPGERIFNLSPDEKMIIFHIGDLNKEALALNFGSEITHLICSGVNFRDFNDKYPGESEGWIFYPAVENWL